MRRVCFVAFVFALAAGCAKSTGGGGDDGDDDGDDVSEPIDASSDIDSVCGDCDNDDDDDMVPDGLDDCPDTPAGEPVNPDGCGASQLTPTLEEEWPPFGLTWTPTG